MGVVVREVKPDEHARVGDVVTRAYATVDGPDHLAGGYGDEILDVAGRLDSSVVLVALDDDGIVHGSVTYVRDPQSAWAEDLRDGEAAFRLLAVDPGAQGRGSARALLDEVVHRARADGREALLLHTTRWMRRAAALYEGLGFRRAPERDFEVDGFELLAYRLPLLP
jgi:ribosomal protein S18 acetylase RimI-like enzyme